MKGRQKGRRKARKARRSAEVHPQRKKGTEGERSGKERQRARSPKGRGVKPPDDHPQRAGREAAKSSRPR